MLVGAAPAASLSLPSVTVSVPVTTPTVTVQAPPPPVKTPTISVPLKAPPPIEVPTVAVKAPTVTAPKVTVKAPVVTVTATTTVSTSPTVSAKAPPAGVPVPSASVNAPGGSTAGSLVTVKVSSTSATSSSNGSAASSRSKTRSGSTGAAHKRSLKAIVAQLRGCLGNLPERQRRLLKLRTGLGAKPLGPQGAAARLHIGPHRFAELEKRALRELRASANEHGCGESAGRVVGGVMSFIGAAFGAGPGEMHGGLQPVSYNLDPRSLRAFLPHAHGPHDGSLDAAISPAATDALLALLLVLVVGVVVAIVVVGASGRGPRDPEWRRRAATRFRVFH
jgi:hypothetical protein